MTGSIVGRGCVEEKGGGCRVHAGFIVGRGCVGEEGGGDDVFKLASPGLRFYRKRGRGGGGWQVLPGFTVS